MIELKIPPSPLALKHKLHYTTVTRRLRKADEEKLGKALKYLLKPYMRKRNIYSIDFTMISTSSRMFSPNLRRKSLKLLVAFSPKSMVIFAGIDTAFNSIEELLEKVVENAPPNSIIVGDREFSSKKCLKKLLNAIEKGKIRGFIVRANKQWHKAYWDMVKIYPNGYSTQAKFNSHYICIGIRCLRVGRRLMQCFSQAALKYPPKYILRDGV